jgi:hypothetical protein
MSRHTPGPWTLRRLEDTFTLGGENVLNHQRIVGDGLSPGIVFMGIAECEANARLIAAAPDLLAALREIAVDILPEFLRDHPGSYRAVQSLHAAIAKAEGR